MKGRIYISSIPNLFTPDGKGQSVGRRSRMVTLVVGLSALVIVVFAAIALGTMTAADTGTGTIERAVAPDPNQVALDRNFGTFSGLWSGYLEREVAADTGTGTIERAVAPDPNQVALDRNFGTFSGLWSGYLEREVATDPNRVALDRNFGTFSGLWTGYLERAVAPDPNQVALDRNFGTFTSVWYTDFADR
jgi:hypothetical protein